MVSCKLSEPLLHNAGSLSLPKCKGLLSLSPLLTASSSCTLTPVSVSPVRSAPTSLSRENVEMCHCETFINIRTGPHDHVYQKLPYEPVAVETKLRYIANTVRPRYGSMRRQRQNPSLLLMNSEKHHQQVALNTSPRTVQHCDKTGHMANHVTHPVTSEQRTLLQLPSILLGDVLREGVVLYAEDLPQETTPSEQGQQPQLNQQRRGQEEGLPSPAQLSFILLKLREEIPSFFIGDHTYSIYAPNLIFTNNLLPFSWTLHSRWSYRCFLASCRALVRLRCSQPSLDLLRITKSVESGKIEARWSLKGKSRLRLKERVLLDGYSEFLVNSEGAISQHKMDCMMPAQKEVVKNKSVFPSPLNLLPKQALPGTNTS